jgi:adenosylcobinamide-GDP ribazoletransferase
MASAVLGAIAAPLSGSAARLSRSSCRPVFFAFRALCLNQIDGQTGDTVGALQQLAEIAILLVASVSIP